jgi:hypothetical protein
MAQCSGSGQRLLGPPLPRAFHTFTTKSFTVRNVSKKPVAVSIDTGFVPDDFSPGQPESTCTPFGSTTLVKGQSCTYVVGYHADPAAPFLGDRRIDLRVVARIKGKIAATKTVVVTATPVPPAEVLDVDPGSVSFAISLSRRSRRAASRSRTSGHTASA